MNTQNIPPATKNILIINIVVYLAMLLGSRVGSESFIISQFALFYPKSDFFRIWQPLTYMFVHGGFWHIFFNMYSLFLFGSIVENMIGTKKFVTFYLLCGLGAAALHIAVQGLEVQHYINTGAMSAIFDLKRTPTVGASGAIYGLLLAYGLLFPESRLTLLFPPVTMKARTMVLVFIGIELVTGVLSLDGIAHFAHLGGMLVGFIMITLWRKAGRLFDRDIWI